MLLRIAFIFFQLMISLSVWATHIVGGSIAVSHLNGVNYRLELSVLRDCLNGQAQFDIPATVAIFEKATHRRMDVFQMRNLKVTPLEITGPNCAPVPNSCTELGVYTMNIQLSPLIYNHPQGYYVVYMRCCRNNIIVNIQNPGDASITIYTEIPPVTVSNSSPNFSNNPFTYLCVNRSFTYNFGFTDKDGDSLVYSLITPVNGPLTRFTPITQNPEMGPYSEISWNGGYNSQLQITGNPALTIDPNTGEINVTPNMPGVHVIAFMVEEYRFGQKIGQVNFELQLTIVNCPINPPPTIAISRSGVPLVANVLQVMVPNEICLRISITDPGDSIHANIRRQVFTGGAAPTTTDTSLHVFSGYEFDYCWQTTCNFTASNRVVFEINTIDNGCPIPSRSRRVFTLIAEPMPVQNSIDILCFYLREDSVIFEYGDSNTVSPLFDKYLVTRAVNDDNYELYDSIENMNLRMFIDPRAFDNRNNNYKYVIHAQNKCRQWGPPSESGTTFENLIETPQNQFINTVTVRDNSHLRIEWNESWEKDFARYQLYKSTRNSTNWNLIREYTNRNITSYDDFDVNVHEQSYCYYLLMRDTCQNISDTGFMACSIVLKGNSHPFNHYLTWDKYTYWQNGISGYELYRKDHLTPFDRIQYIQPGVKAAAADDRLNLKSGIYNYYVVANEMPVTAPSGRGKAITFTAQSNTIELVQQPLLYVPNAFTANNDGLNDAFNIRDVFVKDYQLQIYNRWGQKVFESFDPENTWKGVSMDGDIAQSDVYVYVIRYTGWDDSTHQRTGNVTLLR
jgi:gliding motility-associated-like protein